MGTISNLYFTMILLGNMHIIEVWIAYYKCMYMIHSKYQVVSTSHFFIPTPSILIIKNTNVIFSHWNITHLHTINSDASQLLKGTQGWHIINAMYCCYIVHVHYIPCMGLINAPCKINHLSFFIFYIFFMLYTRNY